MKTCSLVGLLCIVVLLRQYVPLIPEYLLGYFNGAFDLSQEVVIVVYTGISPELRYWDIHRWISLSIA